MHASKSLSGISAPSHVQGLAVVSLALGILGFFFFSLILGPLAILTGYLAMRGTEPQHTAMAKAGIGVGTAVLVLHAILLTAQS
ncbi:DUF4190 domain-containing protein [Streptomyces uncialis]|uniref:DUF4190 domain-containing protein n=1 Tax=Streptomyces uncialis TaxID=1048205 RepID=UPI00383036DB